MVPLAILGSIGMSLAVKVGIGLVASAAKALIDAAGEGPAGASRDAQPSSSFAAHLEREGGRLPAPAAIPPPAPQAAGVPADALSRLALDNGARALALGAHFRADTPRVIGSNSAAPRATVHSLRA
jgi:hypothetical protein